MNDDLEVLQNLHHVSSLKNLLTDNENIALIVTTVILIFKKDDERNIPHGTSKYETLYRYVCIFPLV